MIWDLHELFEIINMDWIKYEFSNRLEGRKEGSGGRKIRDVAFEGNGRKL